MTKGRVDIHDLTERENDLHAWLARHPRPSSKKTKHFRRWRQRRADLALCKSFIAYLHALGPGWYVDGGLSDTIASDDPGRRYDDDYEVVDYVDLNRLVAPLPEGTLCADGCSMELVVGDTVLSYFVGIDPNLNSFGSHRDAAKAALSDVLREYGDGADPAMVDEG